MDPDVHHFHPLKYLERNNDQIGLIILNQDIRIPASLLRSLWEKAVIKGVADGGIGRLHHEYGHATPPLLPDYISGDFDSAEPELLDLYKSKGVEIHHTPDQDLTDFTKCLQIMLKKLDDIESTVDAVLVLSGLGGRFDHEMANINTCLITGTTIPVFLYNYESLAFVLKTGKNRLGLKSAYRGKWCGLVPLERTVVTTRGLKWNLSQAVTEFGGLISTSNKVVDDTVEVEVDRSMVWTMGVEFEPR